MTDAVIIGPLQFSVCYNQNPVNSDGDPVDGNLIHGQQYIEIDGGLTPQAKLATLLHEIVHERLEIQCGHRLREPLVDAIAFMWIEVMRDNPALVKEITG